MKKIKAMKPNELSKFKRKAAQKLHHQKNQSSIAIEKDTLELARIRKFKKRYTTVQDLTALVPDVKDRQKTI